MNLPRKAREPLLDLILHVREDAASFLLGSAGSLTTALWSSLRYLVAVSY